MVRYEREHNLVVSAMFGMLATGLIDGLCVGLGSGILTSTFNMLFDVLKNLFGEKNHKI